MKFRAILIVVAAILLLIIVPVVFAQVSGKEDRQLQGASLAETNYEEIYFHNNVQDLQLAGMIFLPEDDGPYPAVVIIHGSGTSRRDNRWYVTLAHYLQENGIAVLLPDKRGSVNSEGDWHTASFEDLATDTAAAVEYLKGRSDLSISQIGIVGLSQGGHLAPVAAALVPDATFLVNIVGGTVPLHEQLLYEENQNLRQMGLLPGISNLIAYPAAWSIRDIRQKEFWGAVGNFDPLPYWQDLDIEALALYGEIDSNVSSARSAELLRSLNKENIKVKVYEGSGHALQDPEGQGNDLIREEALHAVKEFIFSIE